MLNVGKDVTSFQQIIQAGQYGVAGVTLSVIVQACSNVSLGEPADTSHTLSGGERVFILFAIVSKTWYINLAPLKP